MKTFTLTYVQLEKVLKECKQHAIDNASMSPPAGYEELTPEHAKVADECFHQGLDSVETAVLNWAFDTLGMAHAKDEERYNWLRRFDHLAAVNTLLDTKDFNTLDAAVDHLMSQDRAVQYKNLCDLAGD